MATDLASLFCQVHLTSSTSCRMFPYLAKSVPKQHHCFGFSRKDNIHLDIISHYGEEGWGIKPEYPEKTPKVCPANKYPEMRSEPRASNCSGDKLLSNIRSPPPNHERLIWCYRTLVWQQENKKALFKKNVSTSETVQMNAEWTITVIS